MTIKLISRHTPFLKYKLKLQVLTIVAFLFILTACSNPSYFMRGDYSEIFSPAMGKNMPYSIYTPPNWTPSERLPLMVFLHGARDNHESIDRFGLSEILDAEINAGRVPRVIIVAPKGEVGFWENWYDGSKLYRDWVVRDLMPHVTKRYNTLSCPEHCFVSGISMGGHGALRFAYYEPNTFSSVSAISAPILSKLHPGETTIGQTILKWLLPLDRIWGDIDSENSTLPDDLDPYISWVERKDLIALPLLLVWGTQESPNMLNGNQRFQQHLETNNKQHEWFTYDGAHKWVYWREVFGDVIKFHMEHDHKQQHADSD